VPGHREGDRLDVEHFGFVRGAEVLELTAAVRARTLGRCNEVIDMFEVLGQLLAAHRLAFGGLLRVLDGDVGALGFGHRRDQFLEGQGHLTALDLLGGLTEARSAQLRQLELQVFDLLIPLA
jgi:hypothetical protein